MQKYFRIDKDWGFTKALDEINQYYRPGGIGWDQLAMCILKIGGFS